jgi:hypothetical protein
VHAAVDVFVKVPTSVAAPAAAPRALTEKWSCVARQVGHTDA